MYMYIKYLLSLILPSFIIIIISRARGEAFRMYARMKFAVNGSKPGARRAEDAQRKHDAG